MATITGTTGDDFLIETTSGEDVIRLLEGNDFFRTARGRDNIEGGAGIDQVEVVADADAPLPNDPGRTYLITNDGIQQDQVVDPVLTDVSFTDVEAATLDLRTNADFVGGRFVPGERGLITVA